MRTDPVVGALAAHVLNAALDTKADGPRPARRCGVVTTDAVGTRTTLLLVRYRFHLTLPSRSGERQLVAEDARLLAFQGSPKNAVWLGGRGHAGVAGRDGRREHRPALRGAHDVPHPRRSRRGDRPPGGVRRGAGRPNSTPRTGGSRSASGEIVRGLSVKAQKPADVLGVYVYLPSSAATDGGRA